VAQEAETMTAQSVQQILDEFTAKITERLDGSKLDGPVRVDPTRSYVLITLKGKGPIHVPTQHHIDDEGVEAVVRQIGMVPSLKGLVKES
jgi:hypothetical protein